jgi:hypothetical protein
LDANTALTFAKAAVSAFGRGADQTVEFDKTLAKLDIKQKDA